MMNNQKIAEAIKVWCIIYLLPFPMIKLVNYEIMFYIKTFWFIAKQQLLLILLMSYSSKTPKKNSELSMTTMKPSLSESDLTSAGSCYITIMWCPIGATNKEEEEDLYSFTSMTHALETTRKSPCYVESQPLNSCLKPTNIEKEPILCSLGPVSYKTFTCMKYSNKCLTR